MEYLPALAQQGILGIFLVIALTVIVFLYRENRTLQEKRINDALQFKDAYLSTVKDLLHALENLQRSVDSVIGILDRDRGRT